jgi:hypothetical protein
MFFIAKIREKLRHGLVMQWLSDRLIRIGLEITPFYWVRESADGGLPDGLRAEDFREFSFEELGPDDMEPVLAASSDGFLARGEIQRDIGSPGIKCFALKRFGEIACFTWFNLNECSSYLRPMPLKANEAYLYAMYTMRPYRGRNLAPYLRLKAMKRLNALGKDSFYSISVWFNRPSINFKKKLGATFLELHLRLMFFKKIGFCRRIWTRAAKDNDELSTGRGPLPSDDAPRAPAQ